MQSRAPKDTWMTDDRESMPPPKTATPGAWQKMVTTHTTPGSLEHEVRYEMTFFHLSWHREWNLNDMTPQRRWVLIGSFVASFMTFVALVATMIWMSLP